MSAFLFYGLIFVVLLNAIMFFFAFRMQTDKLTDITYSVSFISLALYASLQGAVFASLGKILITALILLWAIRLGWFLLSRVTALGKDERFDQIRINKKRFFRFFMLQGVSSWIISLPFLLRMSQSQGDSSFDHLHTLEWVGIILATMGFIIEALADHQKSAFKDTPGNRGTLYTEGLYKSIRYPNYLGEIIFWVGIFIACIPYLHGFGWLSIVSPIIIILLLLLVSGIPLLEKSRAEKYGADPVYQSYMKRTKKIIPGIY
jgi:steroid 5-alpha reductase family enzyme